MARTPRYNEGSPVQTQAGSGERINGGRGVSVDSGALMGALETPKLDPRGAIATYQGLADLGEGISRVAQPFLDLAEQQAKMLNANRVAEARKIMSKSEDDLAVKLINEGDETKWPELAKQQAAETGQIISGMNLSPAARDEVDSMYEGWAEGLHGQTLVQSARKTRTDFEVNNMGIYSAAVYRGDKPQADRVVDVMVGAGVKTPGEGEALKEQAERGVQTAQKRQQAERFDAYLNNAIQLGRTVPQDQAIAAVESDELFPGNTPEDKEKLKDAVQITARDGVAAMNQEIANGIASGKLNSPQAIEAAYGGAPYMTPALLEDAKNDLRRFNADVSKRAKLENGDENFVRTFRAAMDWKPDSPYSEKTAREFLAMMSDVARTVPDDLAGEVTEVLHRKFGSPSGNQTLRPIIQRQATQTINASIENSMLPWKTSYEKAKEQYEKSPSSEARKKNFEEANRVFREKERQSFADQAALERKMREFWQANPNADEKATLLHLNKIVPAGTLIRNMETLYGEAPSLEVSDVPTDAGQYQNPGGTLDTRFGEIPEPDLPDGDPGTGDNILIPRFPDHE